MTGRLSAPQQPMEDDELDAISRGGSDEPNPDSDVEVMDLSGVDEKGTFTLVPNGTYNAKITNIEFTPSNSKNNPMLTVSLALTDEPYDSKRLRFYLPLGNPDPEKRANALARVKRFILRVAPGYDLREFRPKDLGVDLLGLPCRVKVTTQPYEGEKRNSVQDVLQPTESEPFA